MNTGRQTECFVQKCYVELNEVSFNRTGHFITVRGWCIGNLFFGITMPLNDEWVGNLSSLLLGL